MYVCWPRGEEEVVWVGRGARIFGKDILRYLVECGVWSVSPSSTVVTC